MNYEKAQPLTDCAFGVFVIIIVPWYKPLTTLFLHQ